MKSYLYLGGCRALVCWQGLRIVTDTRDRGMINWLSNDVPYEPDVTCAIRELLQPGGVFIDVGANVGMHTVLAMSILRGNGLIYSFEPNGALYPTLLDNIALNAGAGVVRPQHAAVYDKAGRMTFSYEQHQHRVGALVVEGATNYGQHTEEVQVVALDSLVDSLPPNAPVLIKIDVEGREGGVLAGARRLIAERWPTIIMEYHQGIMRSVGTDVHALIDSLVQLGYTFKKATPRGQDSWPIEQLKRFEGHVNIVAHKL